jgi:hypothetical protein
VHPPALQVWQLYVGGDRGNKERLIRPFGNYPTE